MYVRYVCAVCAVPALAILACHDLAATRTLKMPRKTTPTRAAPKMMLRNRSTRICVTLELNMPKCAPKGGRYTLDRSDTISVVLVLACEWGEGGDGGNGNGNGGKDSGSDAGNGGGVIEI